MKKQLLFAVLLGLLISSQAICADLDGTSSIIYQDDHFVFHDKDLVEGFVRINNGFTVLSTFTGFWDSVITVSGPIDLREHGVLDLLNDIELDPTVTLSGGGIINGRGNTIKLKDNFEIPDGAFLRFRGDTIIDGGGCALTIGEHANLFLEHDVTVTFKNMTIKTTKNNLGTPPIWNSETGCNIVLDNVNLKLGQDFIFRQGHLFIHNDVVITGTSEFIYWSGHKSFIAPCSSLTFDKDTTFYYAPGTFDNSLFCLQDKTSDLIFDNAQLRITNTGMKLTCGRLCFDNCVTVSAIDSDKLAFATDAIDVEAPASQFYNMARTQDGNFIVIGHTLQDAFYRIYDVSTDSIISVTESFVSFGTGSTSTFGLDWTPDGKFFARSYFFGGGVAVHSFDGSSMPLVDFVVTDTSLETSALEWSPDGRYLFVGSSGSDFANMSGGLDDYYVYSFNGNRLTLLDSFNVITGFGGNTFGLSWHPSGSFIATAETSSDMIYILGFDGSNLSLVTSLASGFSNPEALKWSPDGRYLAAGGSGGGSTLRIFEFDGASLTFVTSSLVNIFCEDVDWSQDGNFLISINLDNAEGAGQSQGFIWRFDGSSLTLLDSIETDGGSSDVNSHQVAWSKDMKSIVIAGQDDGAVGWPLDRGITLYDAHCTFSASSCLATGGLQLGCAELGEEYDIDVTLNSGARVDLTGYLNYDPAV